MKSCDTSWDARPAIGDWYRLMLPGFEAALGFSQSALNAYVRFLDSALVSARRSCGSCSIPETECPPRCTCELCWETCRGLTVSGRLEVRNTGKTPVKISLEAGTFRSDGSDSGVAAKLSPESLTLQPQQTQAVTVTVTPGESFEPNRVYTATVAVNGRYADCAKLRLRVHAADTPVCTLEHGEIPTRIRAHNWFDHFQCEELCYEPVSQRRDPAKA